jgi:AAA+ ATPase superfamily predicted ATPase
MELTNPYHMRGMIPIESDMFFGRENEMRRIKAMLSGDVPQCVSIIGERRIGKSSLAFRVFHRMRNAGNILAIFLDCDQLSRHCQGEEQFFATLQKQFLDGRANREIIKKFCGGDEKREAEKLGRWEDGKLRSELHSISRPHPETDENQHQRFAQHIGSPRRGAPGRRRQEKLFKDYASFRDFLKKVASNQVKTIIFMDEFEHLPEKSFADETFFSNLRSAANHPDNLLSFITISRTELKALTQRSIRTSGFWISLLKRVFP